jgi:beta-glucosidase/6-phospho-beta-glucosidase/beta-galactosidase
VEDFIVATGFECSAPRIAGGLRRDQLLLTDHWNRFEEDFEIAASLGITHVRYGIPFHVVAHDAAAFDWAWTDRALAALRDRGLEPIADLLHFGVPDDLTGFDDPRLSARFIAYVEAFADRYPWVRWYTPVNEPFISAHFSAGLGWWNECEASPAAFVRALDNAATCAVLAMDVIRERRSDAIFLQSDACESFTPSTSATVAEAIFRQERGYLGFDLAYGRPISSAMRAWLMAAGMRADRLRWFESRGSDRGCVVGLDYYEMNEHLVAADGTQSPAPRRGLAALATVYYERYGLPMILAETNNVDERAADWLGELWDDTVRLRARGIPMNGFCWYSLTDQIDWDTCMREENGTVNSFGLVDLARTRRPVAASYASLAASVRAGLLEWPSASEAA